MVSSQCHLPFGANQGIRCRRAGGWRLVGSPGIGAGNHKASNLTYGRVLSSIGLRKDRCFSV